MKKKLFALLLTLAMVLSLFPSSVIAAGTEADPLSAMVDGTCVQVAGLQGELPEGVSLSVEKLEGEKAALYLQDMAKWGVNVKDNALVLDVKLLDEKGMPYQPEEYGQLVQLSFLNTAFGESTKVWHYMSEPAASAEEAPAPEIKAPMRSRSFGPAFSEVGAGFGGVVSCATGSFSVYVIGEEDPRKSITFMNGDEEIVTLLVKNGDDLNTVLYDCSTGIADESKGEKFFGWLEDKATYTPEDVTDAVLIEDLRTDIQTRLNNNDLDPVVYTAAIYKVFNVYYQDEVGAIVKTDAVLFDREDSSIGYTVNEPYVPKDQDEDFQGWCLLGDDGVMTETVYANGTAITLTGDISLRAYTPHGYWLSFNENGRGATYTAPQFIKTGEITSEPTAPTRYGYSFGGWYTTAACLDGEEFAFGKELAQRTDVYAKWIANDTATYTILIWNQNLTGTGYDFDRSINSSGEVGALIEDVVEGGTGNDRYAEINGETVKPVGFHLADFDHDVTIVPEGTSVVNVYFDRNEITLNFYVQGTTQHYIYTDTTGNNGTQYGLVDGEYVQLTRRAEGGAYHWYYETDEQGYVATTETNGTQYGLVNGEYVQLTRSGYWLTGYTWSYVSGYTYTATNSNQTNPQKYGYVDGEYVPLTRSGNTWTYGSGTVYTGTRYTRSENTVEYTGTRYLYQDLEQEYTGVRYTRTSTTYELKYSYSGLYASSLADNNYTWPTDYWWYDKPSGESNRTRTTMLDAFLPTSDNYVLNYYGESGSGDYTIHFMKQDASGNTYTEANTVSTNGRNFNLSDKYDGYTCYAWNTSNNTNSWHLVGSLMNQNGDMYYDAYPDTSGYQPPNWSSSNDLYIFFNRSAFSINYMDGIYVDGNNTQLTDESNRNALCDPITGITYGTDLSSYNKGGDDYYEPTYTGFIFEGWFIDDACTQAYTFTAMPAANVTVYAKWRQIQYRVFLHPNAVLEDGTNDPTLEWGQTNQAMNFRITYGEKISGGTTIGGERQDYELVGWYLDEACTQPFNFSAFVLNDSTVTTRYDKTDPANYTDDMDKYGEIIGGGPDGKGYNSDATAHVVETDDDGNVISESYTARDRFWITRKLDLYAKWRSLLEGANGISLAYDAGEGTGAPTDTALYTDKAKATAGTASVPNDSTLQFKYWVLQTWDADVEQFTDTETTILSGADFTVLKANARQVIEEQDDAGNITKATYTIQLRAEYGPIEDETKTHITWYANNGTTDKIQEGDAPNYEIGYNVAVAIRPANTFSYDHHTFVGWGKADEGASAPTEVNFLWYDADADKFYSDEAKTTEALQIAADENQPYQDLYAIWEEEEVTIHYAVADDSTGMGTVSLESETIGVVTGAPTGSTAVPAQGSNYVIDYWTCDDGTESVGTSATFVPEKNTDGIYEEHTYYAHFKLATTTVTVHHYLKGTTTKVAEDVVEEANVGEEYTAATVATYQSKTLTVDNPNDLTIASVPEDGAEITVYYTIALTITAKTDSKTYDGDPLNGAYTVEGALDADKTAIETALGTAPSITEVVDSPREYPTQEDQSGITGIPEYYVVEYTTGTLTIEPAKITITITGNADTVTYDGKEHKVEGYEAECESELFDAAKITTKAEAVAAGTDAGEYEMGLPEQQFNYEDRNVEATFEITDGKLTIEAQKPEDNQVTVTYDAGDHGTLTGLDSETIQAAENGHGGYVDPIASFTTKGSEVTADEDWLLVNWTNDFDSQTSADGVFTFENVPVGTEITITANYKIDAIGGGDNGKDPDGIPDEYQVIVYYETDGNGTVTGKTFETFTAEEENGQYPAVIAVKSTGSEAEPNEGYALKNWTNDQNSETSADGVFDFGEVKLGSKINVTANFAVDAIGGGDNGDEPDGIPDEYQVIVYYKTDANGKITGKTFETFTAEADDKGEYPAAIAVKSTGSEAEPNEGYALKNWTNDQNSETSADGAFDFGEVKLGSKINVTANFAEDKIGGGDNGDEPDGIPDDIQVIVYYKTDANGKITGKTFEAFTAEADDKGEYPAAIAVKSTGSEAEPNEGYALDNWTNDQNDETSADGVFDFGEVELGTKITITANFDTDEIGEDEDGDGEPDPDGIPDKYQILITYEADANGKITGKTFEVISAEVQADGKYPEKIKAASTGSEAEPNEGYALDNWTNDQNDETSTDGAFDFGEVALGTEITVTANFDIDAIGGGDEGDEPDGTPDKYQILIKYVADAHGTITGAKAQVINPQPDGSGVYPNTVDVSAKGSEAKPDDGYLLKEWSNDFDEQTSTDGAFEFKAVPLGTTITVTASFLSESGDPRTITYKDGVNGTVFQDVVYTAYDGDPTPRFGQEGPGRVNFLFIGWNDGKKTYAPDEELPLVNGDATYTAQWRAALDPIYPPAPVEPSPVLNYDDHVAYIKGFEDGTFRPNDNLTRAQSATMIYRLLTEERQKQIYTTWNNFSDVDASKWYNEYVSSMANGDYVKGYPDGTFGGDKLITRAEFVTMLVRFFGVLDADCRFSDVSRDHWAYQYIATATAYGWLTGYEDNTFRPNQPITRAEAVTVINRMLNRGVDATSNIGLFNVKTFTDVRDASKWYFYEVIEAANDHEYTGHRPNEQWSKVW